MDEHMIELIQDVAGLKVSMVNIETAINDLSHKLLGNGRPGLIADLQSTDGKLADRIEEVDKKATWRAGVWVGASSVVMIVFAVLKFVLSK